MMKIPSKLTHLRNILLAVCTMLPVLVVAQVSDTNYDDGFTVRDNTFNPNAALDSLKASHKEVPKGIRVWTIDEKFGDIEPAVCDTAQHLFMNTIFTAGKYGEYNTTGNLGAPRIARIATDRDFSSRNPFLEPYGYFITQPSDLRFTNTLSPLTNLFYSSCGDKTDGEDHLRVLFANNVNKRLGFGFKFDYLYGRGYYDDQSTALFDYTLWGSYIGERYQAHLAMSFDHMKVAENGGITDDNYITHPEVYTDSYTGQEIPVVLSDNWNKQDAFRLHFSHRYNIGFYRDVEMTEMEKEARRFAIRAKAEQEAKDKDINKKVNSNSQLPDTTTWLKEEYVPVTSFIHTLSLNTNNRRYIANASAGDNFYLNRYIVPFEENPGDSIFDKTTYCILKNTFAIGLLEGFNMYVPMGMKVFLTHENRHYTMPNADMGYTSYNETDISLGGQLIKTLGRHLHYKAQGEFWLVGEDVGDIRLDGTGSLNMRILGDTAAVRLKAFYHLVNPNFLQRHYHGKFFSWSHNDFNKQMQTHLEAEFFLRKTHTTLRACYDNLQNYTYLGINYQRSIVEDKPVITGYTADMMQSSANISLLTLALEQNFRLGILNWENRLTYQKSSHDDILAVPALNYWTNLYLDFRIAKVLRVHFGADMRWFTSYAAPEYCSQVGQYGVQQNPVLRTEVGNYPLVNVYANFHLKKCRFFVMMSHVNAGMGNRDYFFTPHHPLNERILRLGLSWDFNN